MTFPSIAQNSKKMPIFKRKNKLNIGNYRQISILPVIWKVYDFFIVDSMTISSQIIYYHPHNSASDHEQALNMLY